MKSKIPAYILVNARDWAKTSFRHPWQKIFALYFSNPSIYTYGQNSKTKYAKVRANLASDLNKSTSPQSLFINLNKSTPKELVSFLDSLPKDINTLCLSSEDKKTFISKITRNLFLDDSSSYSAIKVLPHIITFNIKPEDISLWSDHSILKLAKSISITPNYVISRKNKASEVLHAIVKYTAGILTPPRPAHIPGQSQNSMLGAGMIHKEQTFITHSTLREHESATNTFSHKQIIVFILLVSLFISGLLVFPIKTMIVFTAILSCIYFLDVLFNLFLVSKSIHTPPELEFTPEEVNGLVDSDLPIYTILVPLYKEANVLPLFLDSMTKMNYPKEKMDVMLLLEEDDKETIQVAKELNLPKYVRTIVVPHSMPKTKPKACNYGLSMAKGEYVVIYDAEDQPDPDQLKKAVLGFRVSPPNIGCLQAKLNYHNKDQNLLTRFFTAEYSLWFDVILPGLQSINTSIPLGGTSNHFRVKDLITFKGWDAFNVTEDADLGSRLFKAGYKTAIINSVTLEEATSNTHNWVRQRSRWIKGYMQTFLVHNRNFGKFFREQGWHALVFQMNVGGKIAFMLINPLLWLMTISYFILYRFVGPTIESFYPAVVFYMAAFSLVVGNFLFLYYYMIGVAKHGHWDLVKFVFLVPLYWLMISRAALKALYQLFFKPHYWEKTIHGHHFKKNKEPKKGISAKIIGNSAKIKNYVNIANQHEYSGGVILIISSIFSSFLNFLYNIYLGNYTSFIEFGLLSLFGSFFYLTQIPFSVFGSSVTYISAFQYGKQGTNPKHVWRTFRKWGIYSALFLTILWLVLTPILKNTFQGDSIWPFIIFAPIWIIGLISSVDSGFLKGTLKFKVISGLILIETIVKFASTYVFVSLNLPSFVYLSLPLSTLVSFLLGWWFIYKQNDDESDFDRQKTIKFPRKFALTNILNKISVTVFMGMDIIIAKIVLSPVEAGKYALISLVGKMLFFFASLAAPLILPMVSKEEGSSGNPLKVFRKIFLVTLFFTVFSYLFLGIAGNFTVPILFGSKMQQVMPLLPFYLLGVSCFTLAGSIIQYHQSRKKYLVSVISFLVAIVYLFEIFEEAKNISDFSNLIGIFGIIQLLVVAFLHRLTRYSTAITQNSYAFFNLFKKQKTQVREFTGQLRFLVLNWRDTKHKWAGGAENYVHELAKNLVDKGHKVTVFSGNDGNSKNREILNGVEVIRRGGFYTVYIWAAIYYIFKFQDRFDIIIDSENGIPFFTPLYSRRPKFLLMHHVHQEVFNDNLKFPLRGIAKFLEGKLMPLVYRNEKVIAVSESTKKDVLKLGIFKPENVFIVNPGIDLEQLEKKVKKTEHPSLLYLGRLKDYKNIDIAIKSFSKVQKVLPEAIFNIGGEGDCESELKKLVLDLGIEKSVNFLGRVTDEDRNNLYASSWLAIQPSSHEGWGITVIEANFYGCPVVASDISGLRDSVVDGKTGILVKPKSVSGFAKAILKVFKRPILREKMSGLGIERSKKFNWSENTDNFLEQLHIYFFGSTSNINHHQ